jgi:4-amino-4-deoxy-L-arabinose transferase-like glycosyltransferase
MRMINLGRIHRLRLIAGLAAGALLVVFWAAPERGPDIAGWRAVLDSALTLLLACTVLVIATVTGRAALRRVAPKPRLDPLEETVFSFALGTAILAFGVFALGLIGLLHVAAISGLLLVLIVLAVPAGSDALDSARQAVRILREDWRGARVGLLLVVGALAVIGLLVMLLALTPPWAYDELMYHLEAPQIFLKAGRVTSLPNLLQANGPLLTQMLYTIGVAFGRDSLAKVTHAVFAVVLLLALLAAGRRLMGPPGGWIAAGILLGIPILPLWGILAYADMTHALYEFLAVWALLRWKDDPEWRWLLLSALMASFAVGTKVIALYMVPPLCIWLVLLGRKAGSLRALGMGAAYAVAVGVVALPWFSVSLLELGDPLYPFLGGGPAWPAERVRLLQDYVSSFGTGRGFTDFVLLPWNLYARHEVFATLMQSIEYPSFLFPLALLLPVVSLSTKVRPLGVFSLLRLATWFVGSQQIRFLLPLFPVFSLMSAAVLLGLERRLRLRLRYPRLTGAIVGGMVVTTLVYVSLFAWRTGASKVVFGGETRADYLARSVYDYGAMRFIQTKLPIEARVLHLWDGQGYYCDERCEADAGQVQWVFVYQSGRTVDGVVAELSARGITHLLLDLEGLNFMLRHDPRGTHLEAARFFLDEFQPACAESIFEEPLVRLYRLTCSAPEAASLSPVDASSSSSGSPRTLRARRAGGRSAASSEGPLGPMTGWL